MSKLSKAPSRGCIPVLIPMKLNFAGDLFKYWQEGTEHSQNCIKSKNGPHYEKPTFGCTILLSYSRGFVHFKDP